MAGKLTESVDVWGIPSTSNSEQSLEEGKSLPKVLYHGSDQRIGSFKKGIPTSRFLLFSKFDVNSQGVFLALSPETASGFGKIVHAVEVSNPNLFIEMEDEHAGVDLIDHRKEKQLAEMLLAIAKDSQKGKVINTYMKDIYVPETFSPDSREDDNWSWVYEVVRNGGLIWDVLDEPAFVSKMESFGYDGTMVAEPDSIEGRSVFISNLAKVKVLSSEEHSSDDGLDEGARGDWEKEGYSIKATPYHGEHHYSVEDHKNIPIKDFSNHFGPFHLIVTAHDKNGQEIGHVETSQSGNKQAIENVYVHHDHQRKGLASAMYRHIEKNYSSIEPSESQTSDGKALWSQPKRPFGEGARGDWEKEGIKIKKNSAPKGEGGDLIIGAFDGQKKVAELRVYDLGRSITSSDVQVDKKYRRKGIATAMYVYAEKLTGKKMIPAVEAGGRDFDEEDIFSDDAKALWSQPKRPFGEGARGDWEKEGYRLEYSFTDDEGIPTHTVTAMDASGEQVGRYVFTEFPGAPSPKYLHPAKVETSKDHQRKGIASSAYSLAQKRSGKKIRRSSDLSSDGKALWSQPKRPFGESVDSWGLPTSDWVQSLVESKSKSTARLPKNSELEQFYFMADREENTKQWREEAREEFDLMDTEEIMSDWIEPYYRDANWEIDEFNERLEKMSDKEREEALFSEFFIVYEQQKEESADSSLVYFEEPRILGKTTLYRFTSAKPEDVLKNGFRGAGPERLGLTHHEATTVGDLAFAFEKKDLKSKKDIKEMSYKYGPNLFSFTVPYAVKAYHNTDYEDQVVFDVTTVSDLKFVGVQSEGIIEGFDLEGLKPVSELKRLTPELAKAAQAVYDDWGMDEFGNVWCRHQEGPGGICHLIADEMISVISKHGFDCTELSHDSMVHVSVLVKTADGVAEVDIDPYRYETGGGYSWKKIPDVQFDPEDVTVHIINRDPEVFDQHLEEY